MSGSAEHRGTAADARSVAPRISVATICFDGFDDVDFARTFRHAPELGVTEIEFNAWYARNLTPAGLESIRTRCEQAGLRPATLQVSGFAPGPDSGDLARETSRWLWLMEAAQRLGAGVLKATGATRGERGGLDAVVRLLSVIGPIAAEHDLTIAVENHFRNVLEHPEDYRRIFEEVTTHAVGMCLDTGHFLASGHDPLGIAEEFADRIVHVDLKDCAAAGSDTFVRFGQGAVDFDAVLGRLASGGFTGYLVVELPLIDRATMAADLRAGVDIAARHLPAHIS